MPATFTNAPGLLSRANDFDDAIPASDVEHHHLGHPRETEE
jgi:hypothetical protein